jgi:hypothetical protein
MRRISEGHGTVELFSYTGPLMPMSNETFLRVVAVIILVLLGSMLIQKYEDCAEHGGKACPVSRGGVSMDPYQKSRTLR